MSPTRRLSCDETIERWHAVLDGDLMDAADRVAMESHLATCSDCAGRAEQLRSVQDMLRTLGESPMPARATERVLERTVRAQPSAPPARRFDWRFAAAAAAVLVVAWIGLRGFPVDTGSAVADAEARRAAADARMVLQLTANALERSQEVTFKEVFADELSPALRKVGVRWPKTTGDAGNERTEL